MDALWGLVGILILVAVAGGQSPGELAAAPGRWVSAGGSPARSGASASRPLRGGVTRVWTFEPEGSVVGEPLVEGETVYAEIERAGKKRRLVALDRRSGLRVATDFSADSALDLSPCVHEGHVVLRASPTQLIGLELRHGRFDTRWRLNFERVGTPIFDGSNLVACADDGLVCYSLEGRKPGRKPSWKAVGEFRGDLTLRDGHVFAASLGSQGVVALVAHDLVDGRRRGFVEVGRMESIPAYHDFDVRIASLDGRIAARFGTYLSGYQPPVEVIGAAWNGSDLWEIAEGMLLPTLGNLPAACGTGWLAHMRRDFNESGERTLVQKRQRDGSQFRPIAGEGTSPRLAGFRGPVTVVGDVAYVGSTAVDLEKLEVLWHADVDARGRAVPVDRGLLLVDAEGRLVCLGSARLDERPATLAAGPPTTVVTRRGEVFASDVEWQEERVLVGTGKRRDEYALDELLLVVDAEGGVRYASGARALAHGFELIWNAEVAEQLTELARDARDTKDPELLERLVARARELGAEDKPLEAVEKAAAKLRAKPKAPNEARVAAVEASFAQLFAGRTERLWAARAGLPESAPLSWRSHLLDLVIAAEPAFPPAIEEIRARIPEAIRPAGAFDAKTWLRYLEFTRRTPVAIIEPPAGDAADDTERMLQIQAKVWRPDVVGYSSPRCLVITPVRDPGRLAHVLAYGELVQDALESIFQGGEYARGRRGPLILQLASDRKEYLAISGMKSSIIERSAGHFSAGENLSRLYLDPEDIEDAAVLSTFAHELTHHWLQVRCTLFPFRPNAAARPGYWIVEGVASLFETFGIDPVEGTWTTDTADADDLDMLAHTTTLFGWKDLFRNTQLDVQLGESADPIHVPSSLLLGRFRVLTPLHVFYAQSAAVCHWLYHAEDGAHRAVLVELVRRYYNDEKANLDPAVELGRTHDDFGQVIVGHAREALGLAAR